MAQTIRVSLSALDVSMIRLGQTISVDGIYYTIIRFEPAHPETMEVVPFVWASVEKAYIENDADFLRTLGIAPLDK